jgi:hypothetical protein
LIAGRVDSTSGHPEGGEASWAAVNSGVPPGRTNNKMAAPVAAQKAGAGSPATVDARLPLEMIHERG